MKRTLAIGDIHGCLVPLTDLWKAVDPRPEDHVVFIGDYVDRGPDAKGVIDFLLRLPPELNVTFLSGNHEEKFFLSRIDKTELAHWLEAWGGGATLESYGPGGFDNVPESHWEFLRKAKPYFETDTHIFVHANLEADLPLDQQPSFTLIHKKFGSPVPHNSGKTMICGHTSQKTHVPLNLGHAICIDTDPDRGGWLTCLHVETGGYWQTNFDGELREGAL
ncbi:MAG: serine/threonine protein phosphatase 1 [Planctomycetota bacterium]|jgi:serine/threonine protein phosphatase 1